VKSETADWELKRIPADAIAAALERAKHYRALNQPGQALSICLDILEIEPDNQEALVLIILAKSDLFADHSTRSEVRKAKDYVARLSDEFQRHYYAGIIAERQGAAFLQRGHAQVFAYEHYRDAMDHYAEAEKLSDHRTADPLLRWNACLRAIRRERLRPQPPDTPTLLE